MCATDPLKFGDVIFGHWAAVDNVNWLRRIAKDAGTISESHKKIVAVIRTTEKGFATIKHIQALVKCLTSKDVTSNYVDRKGSPMSTEDKALFRTGRLALQLMYGIDYGKIRPQDVEQASLLLAFPEGPFNLNAADKDQHQTSYMHRILPAVFGTDPAMTIPNANYNYFNMKSNPGRWTSVTFDRVLRWLRMVYTVGAMSHVESYTSPFKDHDDYDPPNNNRTGRYMAMMSLRRLLTLDTVQQVLANKEARCKRRAGLTGMLRPFLKWSFLLRTLQNVQVMGPDMGGVLENETLISKKLDTYLKMHGSNAWNSAPKTNRASGGGSFNTNNSNNDNRRRRPQRGQANKPAVVRTPQRGKNNNRKRRRRSRSPVPQRNKPRGRGGGRVNNRQRQQPRESRPGWVPPCLFCNGDGGKIMTPALKANHPGQGNDHGWHQCSRRPKTWSLDNCGSEFINRGQERRRKERVAARKGRGE